VWAIPQGYYTPIAQQAVLLKTGEKNPAAHALLAYLKGEAARKVITGYGYGVE
jgi:molybdate transport system substrate-binding protein